MRTIGRVPPANARATVSVESPSTSTNPLWQRHTRIEGSTRSIAARILAARRASESRERSANALRFAALPAVGFLNIAAISFAENACPVRFAYSARCSGQKQPFILFMPPWLESV